MKGYFSILSISCAFGDIAGAVAQEASPAADFEYDLNTAGDGVIIGKYKGTATEVVIPAVIEDFPVVMVAGAFSNNRDVVSVIFPDSVIKIGGSCFTDCISLQKVVLPKNLKVIGTTLFAGCTTLKTITLPDRIEEIHPGAFKNSGLESITISGSVKDIASRCRYSDSTNGAFENCKNLHTVTIGNGTKEIGASAFYACTNLTTVTIGSDIQSIESEAFRNCSSLTTVNIGVEKLIRYDDGKQLSYGDNVFRGCSSLSLKERKKIRDTGYIGAFMLAIPTSWKIDYGVSPFSFGPIYRIEK